MPQWFQRGTSGARAESANQSMQDASTDFARIIKVSESRVYGGASKPMNLFLILDEKKRKTNLQEVVIVSELLDGSLPATWPG